VNMDDEYRLCECSECGNKFNQGTFKEHGFKKPQPHRTYEGDYCGEMEIINEPPLPLHWSLIKALVFSKWELEESKEVKV
jgi:hypothetical protein